MILTLAMLAIIVWLYIGGAILTTRVLIDYEVEYNVAMPYGEKAMYVLGWPVIVIFFLIGDR